MEKCFLGEFFVVRLLENVILTDSDLKNHMFKQIALWTIGSLTTINYQFYADPSFSSQITLINYHFSLCFSIFAVNPFD
jgi:hypothetical protein